MQVSSLSATPATQAGSSPEKAALTKVAQQFEAIFLRQMMGAMRSSNLDEGMFDSGATQQFQDMADSRTADAMAQKGSLGIAELLVQQLGARMSPAATPNPAAPAQDKGA